MKTNTRKQIEMLTVSHDAQMAVEHTARMDDQRGEQLRRVRQREEENLMSCGGDIFALVKTYRLFARMAVLRGTRMKYSDLPKKLRSALTPEQFLDVAMTVLTTIGTPLGITYPANTLGDYDEQERSRRVAIYEKQWRDAEATLGTTTPESQKLGSMAQEIIDSMGAHYESARQAASIMQLAGFPKCRRSDIRNAIRFGRKCCGLNWSYGDKQVMKLNRRQRRVFHPDDPAQTSTIVDAAKAQSMSPKRLAYLIITGQSELRFEVRADEMLFSAA